MATIVDVARLAGVSTATVSRVFNGQSVSPARSEAVRRAADELGFVPNRTARSLRRRHSEMIALVFPDVENPYFTEIARGVEDVARSAGYSVVLCNTDADHEKEAEYLRVAASTHMAGVILAAADDASRPVVADGGPAIVAIDRAFPAGGVDEIVMDNREAGRLAAASIAGADPIVCLTGPASVGTARERAEGASEAGAVEVVHASFGVEGGRRQALELLARPERPGGIVAANNLLGVGVLQALASAGLTTRDVPVAVVGALPFTTLHPQAVPVVRLPSRRMGELAAEMLLRRVAGDGSAPERVVLHGVLQPAVDAV
ncbi:LacI family DNA-binding transcriptional regulator [Microbacterium sp. gxy059]|uniref:LacI family DNA-binding transcriptional regulator n=1 Tax=Microbacterium sp. gxy059 TaxID=2957199 RepID=UPI003D95426C